MGTAVDRDIVSNGTDSRRATVVGGAAGGGDGNGLVGQVGRVATEVNGRRGQLELRV
ncbi:MAG: hypothetical protein IPM98_20270 [Lewinellaceae bacterium]|nr:hypothetical protein [Lewinellaceae bacterium]